MKHVLFVCTENACRSQIAEAYAHLLGRDLIVPYSSGSAPSGVIHPRAIRAMAEVGYDLSLHHSKGLDALPDREFDMLVTMGCGDHCPAVRALAREQWSIPDPKDMAATEFSLVRETIRDHVAELAERLTTRLWA